MPARPGCLPCAGGCIVLCSTPSDPASAHLSAFTSALRQFEPAGARCFIAADGDFYLCYFGAKRTSVEGPSPCSRYWLSEPAQIQKEVGPLRRQSYGLVIVLDDEGRVTRHLALFHVVCMPKSWCAGPAEPARLRAYEANAVVFSSCTGQAWEVDTAIVIPVIELHATERHGSYCRPPVTAKAKHGTGYPPLRFVEGARHGAPSQSDRVDRPIALVRELDL